MSKTQEDDRVEVLDQCLKRLERKYGEHVDRPTLLLVAAILLASGTLDG